MRTAGRSGCKRPAPGPFLGALVALAIPLAVSCGRAGDSPTTPAPPPPLEVPFSSRDLAVGNGPEVHMGWLLAIGYSGWIYEPSVIGHRGTQWVSVPAANPFSFRLGVGQVIAGVDQGLGGMRVGGVRELVVPPDLGFGVGGNERVPPNATVILEVELVAGAEVPFSAEDLAVGEGAEAANGRSLSVNYSGWLYDLRASENKGELFDSNSLDSPFVFTLGAGAVIEGWDRGLAGMRVGGRRRLVIPHDLAYGATGAGPIPEFATLLFEVELLEAN